MTNHSSSPTPSRRRWSRERVLAEICARHQANRPLNAQALTHEDPSLLAAGRRYFGSWPKALTAAGIAVQVRAASSARHHRGYWTRERIAQEIRRHAAAGHPLHAHAMQQDHNQLVSAATYHYGSWRQALQAAGFNPEALRGARRHSCESVAAEIQRLMSEGADLRDCAVRRHYRPLYWAAQKYFGSWRTALDKARQTADPHTTS
ncbi:homing endonuclease associated repeat-containing protein [Sulfobacillus harzensis]|uniref:Uncharacterized protein n=1 Tax=Sulfobacillus harzensis TaxID=2729629 RepID=A0A7Y0Q2M7_9FIRM|nr:hypothetical protein [Sulfobacillus harzensis]NMP23343.1 hypothetical protein [Sulfobacillus harzensis]